MKYTRLIIHGGAGSIEKSRSEVQISLKEIYLKSEAFLQKNSALDTVVYAVTLLEDCPLFNAGTGSQIQADGTIRMSASIMDGKREQFAAVLNIERVQNPIQVAKELLHKKDRVLAGKHATRFAREQGFKSYNPRTKQRYDEWLKKSGQKRIGTVGACALDLKGHLAAATSTGGRGFEIPGRVSDSGTPAGNYANQYAAVSATGIGEEIINECLSAKIVIRTSDGISLQNAFQKTFQEVKKRRYHMGAIGISDDGSVFLDYSTPKMNAAYRDPHQKLIVLF